MKTLVKSLVLVGAMVGVGSAAADMWGDLSPYAGIDYKHTWVKGNAGWGNILPKSFPGATLYVGSKFCICDYSFGGELGYNWTARRKRTATFGNFFGFNVTGVAATRASLNSVYFDLAAYWNIDSCWDVFGVVGLAAMKPRVSLAVTSAGNLTAADVDGINSIHGKTKAIFRLGLGTNYMFTECVGFRLKLLWENTSRLRIAGNANFVNNWQNFGTSTKIYKDAISLAAGVFFKF